MRHVVLVLLVTTLAPAPALGALSADGRKAVAEARAALQEAVDTASPEGMLAVRAGLLALDAAAQSDPAVRYTILLANWRVAPLLSRAKKPATEVLMYVDEGIAHAVALERLTPKDPEPYALHASLLGLTMTLAGADMMTLGPQSMSLMQRAVKLDQRNPRVQCLNGIQIMHTPEGFGGGAAAALPVLRTAAALFDSVRATDPLAPAWGGDDAYVWLAHAQVATRDSVGAIASIDAALARNPANGWARGIREKLRAAGAGGSR